MNTIRWVHPESLDELRRLLADGARLHGGGTGLMRNPPRSGVVANLARLGLDTCSTSERALRFGGTASIAAVQELVAAHDPEHIVAKAWARMAAPALRNRITIGGSVALFPPWSCVIAPLLATGARVTLIGSHEGSADIAEYLQSREMHRGSAIVEVEIDPAPGYRSYWFAFARARFNYPLFAVAVVGRASGGTIEDVRIAITGNRGRYRRVNELESRLAGNSAPIAIRPEDLGTIIPDRQGFSSEYLTHLAALHVGRGLAAVAGGHA